MRKFKKALAVVSAAVMTMAMGVTAFADQTVTYHFYNAANWENVGAWIKQGVDWKDDCMPVDENACVYKDQLKADGTKEPIWPGNKMESEGGGWYKITCTYTAPEKGSMLLFNNYVGDSTPTDTTSEADIQKLKDAGIALNDTATKAQTPNIMIKKNELAGTEYFIKWDGNTKGSMIVLGKSDQITTEAPAEYTSRNDAAGSGTPAADNAAGSGTSAADNAAGNGSGAGNVSGNTGNGNAAGSSTTTTGSKTTGTTSGTKAPTTGDTVAVSVVLLGLASVVAVVASKKKANA